MGLLKCLSGKELVCQCRRHRRFRFDCWVGKIPWRHKWKPIPVFLPGKCHDRGTWWATVHGVMSVGHDWASEHTCTHPWDHAAYITLYPTLVKSLNQTCCWSYVLLMRRFQKSSSCSWHASWIPDPTSFLTIHEKTNIRSCLCLIVCNSKTALFNLGDPFALGLIFLLPLQEAQAVYKTRPLEFDGYMIFH